MPDDSNPLPQLCVENPHNCGSWKVNLEATFYGFIDREFAPKRNAAKLLAKAAGGVSHRTSENWLRKVCMPRSDDLIRLMANCEDLRADIIRLTAKEGE